MYRIVSYYITAYTMSLNIIKGFYANVQSKRSYIYGQSGITSYYPQHIISYHAGEGGGGGGEGGYEVRPAHNSGTARIRGTNLTRFTPMQS